MTTRQVVPALGAAHIVLVEGHRLFAETLALALEVNGFRATQAEAGEDHTTARLVRDIVPLRPTVVLLGLDLARWCHGTRFIAPLVDAGVAVAVVTSSQDRARLGECLALGARTVITKDAPLVEILASIRRLAEGRSMLASVERQELVDHWLDCRSRERELASRLEQLTPREAEVLGDLMLGKQIADIARDQFVSVTTARTHVKSILAKLQVRSQLTAVGLAHRAGWRVPGRAGSGTESSPGPSPQFW